MSNVRLCAAGCGNPILRRNQQYCSDRCRQRGKRDRDRTNRDRKQREQRSRLYVVHLSLAVANEFVRRFHRHNDPVPGSKINLGAVDEQGMLRGIAIVGRPVARALDDGWTLEVNRVVTDLCPNACSFLYGAARRVAFELGYRRLVTYTLQSESGASMRGAGWKKVAETTPMAGKGWKSREGRKDQPVYALPKYRWEAVSKQAQKQGSFSGITYPWDILQRADC